MSFTLTIDRVLIGIFASSAAHLAGLAGPSRGCWHFLGNRPARRANTVVTLAVLTTKHKILVGLD